MSAPRWARRAYGLDLSGPEPVCVMALRDGRGLSFKNLAPGDVPSVESASGDDVVCAVGLGPRESVVRQLDAPFDAVSKALRVFPSLLDIEMPFAIEACSYAFVGVGAKTGGGVKGLGVAAQTPQVQACLQRAGAHGIDPMRVDVDALALWSQGLREAPAPHAAAESARIQLHLGRERTVMLIGRDEALLSVHAFKDDPLRHLDRLLRAQFAEIPTALTWVLSGAGAADDARVAALQSQIGATEADAVIVTDEPVHMLARALATRALSEGPLDCNLRTGDLAHERMTRDRSTRDLRLAALCLLAGLILIAVNVTWRYASASRVETVKEAFVDRATDLAERPITARGSRALDQVRNAVEARSQAAARFRRFLAPSATSHVVAMAQAARAAAITLAGMSYSDSLISLSVAAPDGAALQVFVTDLRARGYRVQDGRRSVQDGAGLRAEFTVEVGP